MSNSDATTAGGSLEQGPALEELRLPIFGTPANGTKGNLLQLLRDQHMQRPAQNVDGDGESIVVFHAPVVPPSPPLSQSLRPTSAVRDSPRSSFNILLMNGVNQDVHQHRVSPTSSEDRAVSGPPVKFNSMQAQRSAEIKPLNNRSSSPGHGHPSRLRSKVSLTPSAAGCPPSSKVASETSIDGSLRTSPSDRSPILALGNRAYHSAAQQHKQQQQQLQHEQLRRKLVYVPSSKSSPGYANPGFARMSPTGPFAAAAELRLQPDSPPQSSVSKLPPRHSSSSQPASPITRLSSASPRASETGAFRRPAAHTQHGYVLTQLASPLPCALPAEALLGHNVMQRIQEATLSPGKPVSAVRTLSTPSSPLGHHAFPHHAFPQRPSSSMVFFLAAPQQA